MKHIRITVEPDREAAPPFLAHLLDPVAIEEARAVDWNRGDAAVSTHLYAIDGDGQTFAERAAATTGVETVHRAGTDDAISYVMLEIRDATVPIFGAAATAIDRTGLVVRRPMVYRDGHIEAHVVGDPAVLQAAIDRLPDDLTVRVDAIREFPSPVVNPATGLSERQQAAVEAALELGYYEAPRAATHADVASAIGCAPNTATEHLQKAEAKLVRAGLAGLESPR